MESELETRIYEIGKHLVECNRSCADIVCNRSSGQIPRCMFLQTDGRSGTRGAAIVGLNPGRSSDEEQDHYKTNGCTYDSVVSWFRDSIPKHGMNNRYYKRLLDLVNELGLDGPILWTELAKCENAPNVKDPSLQTFRTCTDAFLQHEIDLLPQSWPLFGIGKNAYIALAYRFPARMVIGVPHPTGSWGYWLFEKNDRLYEKVEFEARKALSKTNQAIWLGDFLPLELTSPSP